jgi:hypothetical protein
MTISQEITNPSVLSENTYNIDETGILLALLKTLKVLMFAEEISQYRGAAKKTRLIIVIKCISATGKVIHLIVIWPASTHQSNWMTYSTPGWHYANSPSGYTNNHISLEWLKKCFHPQIQSQAGNNCQLLIADGFGTHKSAEI